MNEEVKAKWVEALRSGEYKQTRSHLKDDKGFCCLGVLCAVYKDETGAGDWSNHGSNHTHENFKTPGENSWSGLPEVVQDWAGLEGSDPEINETTLAGLNDDERLSFAEIADAIEAHL